MSTTTEDDQRKGKRMELMGKDLQMKIVQLDDSVERGQSCDVGDAILVNLVGYFANKNDKGDWKEGPIFQEAKDWWVVVGERDVTPAIEMGIRFLHIGEHGVVQSHYKYAHGGLIGRKHGEYELPPFSDVIYKIHNKSVVKSSSKEFSQSDFQIKLALSYKTIGNDIYLQEWGDEQARTKAVRLYQKGANAMTNLVQASIDLRIIKKANELQLDCLNNVAAVHLRAKQYSKAKEAATQVLLNDPQNRKGLCRAATACMLDPASTFEESNAAIEAAERVDIKDPGVIKLRSEFKWRKHDYKNKKKKLYSKMSKAMKPEAPKKQTHDPKDNSPEEENNDPQEDVSQKEIELKWKKRKQHFVIHCFLFIIQLIVFKWVADKYGYLKQENAVTEEHVIEEDRNTEF